MNLITEFETNGMKFVHQFNETSRESESINSQINTIRHIIAMLNNELSYTELETAHIEKVYD